MAVSREPNGKTWQFVINIPSADEGRRRQMRRRGFTSQRAARDAERTTIDRLKAARLAVDGTVADVSTSLTRSA